MTNFFIWNSDSLILEKDGECTYVINVSDDDSVYTSFDRSAKKLIQILKNNIDQSDLLEALTTHYSSGHSPEEISRALDLFIKVLIEQNSIQLSLKPPQSRLSRDEALLLLEGETHLNLKVEFYFPSVFDVSACEARGAYCDNVTPCCSGNACFSEATPPLYPGVCVRMGGGS